MDPHLIQNRLRILKMDLPELKSPLSGKCPGAEAGLEIRNLGSILSILVSFINILRIIMEMGNGIVIILFMCSC